jgi:anti-sigma B factor antagonist
VNLETHVVEDVHVLTLHRNLAGGKETQELHAAVDAILARSTPRIVIDLGKVDFLSSLGLSAFVKIHTSCVNRGGWMRIARISKRIHNVLLITRLVMVFDTADTVEQAIASGRAEEAELRAKGHPMPPGRAASLGEAEAHEG